MNDEVPTANGVHQAEVEAIALRVKALLMPLDAEKVGYFSHLLDMMSGCFTNKDLHAALLISNDVDGTKSLAAINADDVQIADLVGFMADSMRQQNTHQQGSLLN